ncbi:OmpW/AlkL family protein [Larsenimonas suaedae]|uniref:OmpW family outer membrane protein n=1 Tax=Larsenimonas suaedae TaxID=1851019 RepID=A0ABU1GY91_9GAMM|nr:OmpW family outer membrane protein [Larsenimonas suaedae]MCM2972835.1 outer membrane beta-barrel protein [Larsenimonas suaedae]MDR5896934.1 OmpW family outer membrane protein [Larsenimonas suaedae]
MKLSKIISVTILAGASTVAAQSALAYGAGDIFVRGDVSKTDATATGNYEDDTGWTGSIGYMPMDKLGVALSTSDRTKFENKENGSSFKARPYSLLVQYYPLGGTDAKVQPYVGGGATYVRFNGEENGQAALDDSEWGWTGQAGVDLNITNNWALNGFAQYTDVDATASSTGNHIDIDPVTVGGGVTYRF